MKPLILTHEQRQEIERRKETLDRRIYQRADSLVLAVAAGNTREEVAELLGVSLTQLGEWLRIYRNRGLDALCTLHYKGDPGKLTPHQVEQLKSQSTPVVAFVTRTQIRDWLEKRISDPLLLQRREGFAQTHRRHLPQGDRLPVESRSGQTAGIHPQV